MPISSLPDECFSDVLSYLDEKTLYRCLFVNRYFCKFTIPLIWRDPFKRSSKNIPIMSSLLSCLNEDEISSLIPCAINFNNDPSPLFEYGKFIRKFNHCTYVDHIITWLGLSHDNIAQDIVQDCRVQKLSNVIYHMIMRQGSNLQEFLIYKREGLYADLPKLSTFTTYEPGITNLRYLNISFKTMDGCENIIEFLNMVSKSCNGIVDCVFELNCPFPESFVDIIKSQPLERFSLSGKAHIQGEDKKVIYALEFRSGTLKELTFQFLDFRDIDLSFMSKLDRLERLKLDNCRQCLFTKKLQLKELTLCYPRYNKDVYDYNELKITGSMINLLSEELYMLDFRNTQAEVVKAVRESCPNLKFLQIRSIDSESSILPICEISSLKILKIDLRYDEEVPSGILVVKMLGDNLKFVECLSLNFNIDLQSFEYFTNNCKADLKKLIIHIDSHQNLRRDYLIYVSDYQKVHNSLKLFEIIDYAYASNGIIDKELKIIDLLKNQGIDVKINK